MLIDETKRKINLKKIKKNFISRRQKKNYQVTFQIKNIWKDQIEKKISWVVEIKKKTNFSLIVQINHWCWQKGPIFLKTSNSIPRALIILNQKKFILFYQTDN